MSLAGIPSICTRSTSPGKLPIASPKIISPPHKPLTDLGKSSPSAVNIIGCCGVPTAFTPETGCYVDA